MTWVIAIAVGFAVIAGAMALGLALAAAQAVRDQRRELDALIEHVDATERQHDRQICHLEKRLELHLHGTTK